MWSQILEQDHKTSQELKPARRSKSLHNSKLFKCLRGGCYLRSFPWNRKVESKCSTSTAWPLPSQKYKKILGCQSLQALRMHQRTCSLRKAQRRAWIYHSVLFAVPLRSDVPMHE